MLLFLLSISDEETKPNIIELYNLYKDPLLKIATNRLKSAGDNNYTTDAQDVVQNVFVKTVKYINKIPSLDQGEQKAYLYAILQNEICGFLTEYNKQRNESYELGDTPDDKNFIEVLEIKEHYNEVINAIYSLDEKYSTVLLLKYARKQNTTKIARMLGISRTAVNKRLNKGKSLLLKALEKGKH